MHTTKMLATPSLPSPTVLDYGTTHYSASPSDHSASISLKQKYGRGLCVFSSGFFFFTNNNKKLCITHTKICTVFVFFHQAFFPEQQKINLYRSSKNLQGFCVSINQIFFMNNKKVHENQKQFMNPNKYLQILKMSTNYFKNIANSKKWCK